MMLKEEYPPKCLVDINPHEKYVHHKMAVAQKAGQFQNEIARSVSGNMGRFKNLGGLPISGRPTFWATLGAARDAIQGVVPPCVRSTP